MFCATRFRSSPRCPSSGLSIARRDRVLRRVLRAVGHPRVIAAGRWGAFVLRRDVLASVSDDATGSHLQALKQFPHASYFVCVGGLDGCAVVAGLERLPSAVRVAAGINWRALCVRPSLFPSSVDGVALD